MNKALIWICAVALATLVAGCSVKDIASQVEYTVKGDYYLKNRDSEQGRESFRQAVEEDPENGLARYYYGRFLLQNKESRGAVAQFAAAAELIPGNADYHFWLGVAYSDLGKSDAEEKSYRAALGLDPDHLQSLVYLGHILLAQKDYPGAYALYSRALDLSPGIPSAQYNRALILQKLGRTPEAKLAWLIYLNWHPSGGAMARRAVIHLNSLSDYSFRNHQLGPRTVTIEKVRFEPFTAEISDDSFESLNLIGGVIKNMKKGKLEILAYQKNNKLLAQKRAVAIKRYLLDRYPSIPANRIGISWFPQAETIVVKGQKKKVDESISFFLSGV